MAETVNVRNIRMVNPQGTDLISGEFRLNERPNTLTGRTLGLLENSKANSDKVLFELGQILNEKHALKDVLYFGKHNASLPTKSETIQGMLNQVDVLVTGVGD